MAPRISRDKRDYIKQQLRKQHDIYQKRKNKCFAFLNDDDDDDDGSNPDQLESESVVKLETSGNKRHRRGRPLCVMAESTPELVEILEKGIVSTTFWRCNLVSAKDDRLSGSQDGGKTIVRLVPSTTHNPKLDSRADSVHFGGICVEDLCSKYLQPRGCHSKHDLLICSHSEISFSKCPYIEDQKAEDGDAESSISDCSTSEATDADHWIQVEVSCADAGLDYSYPERAYSESSLVVNLYPQDPCSDDLAQLDIPTTNLMTNVGNVAWGNKSTTAETLPPFILEAEVHSKFSNDIPLPVAAAIGDCSSEVSNPERSLATNGSVCLTKSSSEDIESMIAATSGNDSQPKSSVELPKVSLTTPPSTELNEHDPHEHKALSQFRNVETTEVSHAIEHERSPQKATTACQTSYSTMTPSSSKLVRVGQWQSLFHNITPLPNSYSRGRVSQPTMSWINATSGLRTRFGTPSDMPREVCNAHGEYEGAGERFAELLYKAAEPHCDISEYADKEPWWHTWKYTIKSTECYVSLADIVADLAPEKIELGMLFELRAEFMWRWMVDDWYKSFPSTNGEIHRLFTKALGDVGRVLYNRFLERHPKHAGKRFMVDEEVYVARQNVGL